VAASHSRSLLTVEILGASLAVLGVSWVIAAPGGVPEWEQSVVRLFNGLPDWLFPVIWGPMQLGSLVGALLVAFGLFAAQRRACAVTYAAAVVIGWLVAVGVKQVVGRERPVGAGLDVMVRGADASGFGFISGHTTVAFAGATVIWAFYRRSWGLAAFGLAGVVGISRMYVGAHLPLDVVGGAAVGVFVGGLVTLIEHIIGSRREAPTIEDGMHN